MASDHTTTAIRIALSINKNYLENIKCREHAAEVAVAVAAEAEAEVASVEHTAVQDTEPFQNVKQQLQEQLLTDVDPEDHDHDHDHEDVKKDVKKD